MLLGTLRASLLEILKNWKKKIGKGEIKCQESGFLTMIALLTASLLGSLLTGKGIIRSGDSVVRRGTGYSNLDHRNKNFFLRSLL